VLYGASAAKKSFLADALSIKTLVMPEWWILAPLPICFLLLAIEFLFRMRRLKQGEIGPRDDAVSAAMTSWTFAAWLLLGRLDRAAFPRLPVAFSFLVVNIVGAWLWLGGEPGFVQLARNAVSSVTSFSLTPIPLFVLMGEILFHTGLAVKVIDGIERLIAQVPGRLAVVAVVAGTVFSAISGSTIATTAMLGSLMVPVMLSRGYHPTLATGPVMAIGAVDMLIPPSALTVLLGSLSASRSRSC
jgi:TRAP-type mannitol/chloroaromatic compound transport system permease large subunit